MADGLLKLCGEPSVPGLALPKAFESLEKNLEAATNLCKLKGSQESQASGILLVCRELQRLLRLAFIENGILASRIEMLSCYQDDFIRKCEKKMHGFNVEQKIGHRYLKKLRKRQLKYETARKKKTEEKDWLIEIACSDYDTVSNLSRICGSPDLEFMLRMNQLLLDFVKDTNTNELFLPPMGSEERTELSKLASLYKLRCRFNKSTQVASSVIIKARQTCLPAPGEIDVFLNPFTKKMKDGTDCFILGSPKNEQLEKDDPLTTSSTVNDPQSPLSSLQQSSSTAHIKESITTSSTPPLESSTSCSSGSVKPTLAPSTTSSTVKTAVSSSQGPVSKEHSKDDPVLPSYMLTPVSSIGTPTITLEGGELPSTVPSLMDKDPIASSKPDEGGTTENPLPPYKGGSGGGGSRSSPNIDPSPMTATAAQALLKLLPEGFEPTTTTSPTTAINITKTQPSMTPSSSLYTNLIPPPTTSSSPSTSALQMALLMQSHQQLRALSAAAAAVTAGGNQAMPIPVTTAPMTPPSSGRSTVLATPFPLSFSGSNKSPGNVGGASVKRSAEVSGNMGGAGIKRSIEVTSGSNVSGASVKRSAEVTSGSNVGGASVKRLAEISSGNNVGGVSVKRSAEISSSSNLGGLGMKRLAEGTSSGGNVGGALKKPKTSRRSYNVEHK